MLVTFCGVCERTLSLEVPNKGGLRARTLGADLSWGSLSLCGLCEYNFRVPRGVLLNIPGPVGGLRETGIIFCLLGSNINRFTEEPVGWDKFADAPPREPDLARPVITLLGSGR